MRLLAVLVSLLVGAHMATHAQQTTGLAADGDRVEVLAFAVRLESEASHLKPKRDLCVALDTKLQAREENLISALRTTGLAVHPSAWCNKQLGGLEIEILAPIDGSVPGEYEVTVQVGDLTIKPGEHFATLLRQGVYKIRLDKGSKPELISYKKTCCPRTN